MISRKALMFGLVGLIFVAGGTATVLESFGTISGAVTIEKPLEIDQVYYDSNISHEESGEYVLLENNQESFNLSNWNLTSAGYQVALDYGEVSNDYIALADNSGDKEDVEFVPPDGKDVKILKVGNLGDSGLGNSETIGIRYTPENVSVDSLSYDDEPECNDSQAVNSSGKCEEAFLDVEKVNSQ